MYTLADKTLYNRIMRRIYYAYVIDILAHPLLRRGVVLSVSLGLLSRFVSMRAIIENTADMDSAQMPYYVMSALEQTEAWTLLALLGLAAVLYLSCRDILWSRVRRQHIFHSAFSH